MALACVLIDHIGSITFTSAVYMIITYSFTCCYRKWNNRGMANFTKKATSLFIQLLNLDLIFCHTFYCFSFPLREIPMYCIGYDISSSVSLIVVEHSYYHELIILVNSSLYNEQYYMDRHAFQVTMNPFRME